ncbi:MAG: hypothetical protein WD872_08025 [Pirellulaceae bacterium]
MPVPDGREVALLRIGRREVPVSIQDESSGGLSVLCSRNAQVVASATLELRTAGGAHYVKVIRVQILPEGKLVGLERGPEAPKREKQQAKVMRRTLVAAVIVGVLSVPAATALFSLWKSPKPPAESSATELVFTQESSAASAP